MEVNRIPESLLVPEASRPNLHRFDAAVHTFRVTVVLAEYHGIECRPGRLNTER